MRGKEGIFDFEKSELIAYANAESIQYQSSIQFSEDGNFLAATSNLAQQPIKIFQLADSPDSN